MKEQAKSVDPESLVPTGSPSDETEDATSDDASDELDQERAVRREAGAIPSTLDPDAEIEPIDSDMNLEGLAEADRDYPMDNRTESMLPEEQIGERIAEAEETIPPEMPADRADRTDEREERPPRNDLLD